MDFDSDRIVSESDVPDLLYEYLNTACSLLQSENPEEALSSLQKSEELLEAVATQGGTFEPDLLLLTLHNTSLCYQQLGMYPDCVSYLDGCIFNVENSAALNSKAKSFGGKSAFKIRKARYLSRVNVQLCAILSLLEKHEQALVRAKRAYNQAEICVKELQAFCASFAGKHKKLKKEEFDVYDSVLQLSAVLEYLIDKKSKKKIEKFERTEFNVGDLMVIPMFSLSDIQRCPTIQEELGQSFEIVCLMIVSLFSIATELGHINKMAGESKSWHLRAIKMANDLLSPDSALRNHLQRTFNRKFKKRKRRTQNNSPTRKPHLEKTPVKLEKIEVKKHGSERSSVDSDYFRKNFVLDSNELYGENPLDFTDEDWEDKHEFMPRTMEERPDSSTGGKK